MNCSNDNYGFYLDGENQVIINCSVCMDNSQSGIYYCDGNGFSSIYEIISRIMAIVELILMEVH